MQNTENQHFMQMNVDFDFGLWYAEYVGAVMETVRFFVMETNTMVRELVHDPILLARKSQPAAKEDLPIARDLMDTLLAHRETCVGMAANMIGETKRIIVFQGEKGPETMLNPEILRAEGEYETEEGCLSLLGGPRKTRRFQKIKVRYENLNFQSRIKTYTGWTAQIIQHEIDHCSGILI